MIQPKFSKNGLAFAGMEGSCVSEVASHRLGNERAVMVLKRSKHISRGSGKVQYFRRVNCTWKSFLFRETSCSIQCFSLSIFL